MDIKNYLTQEQLDNFHIKMILQTDDFAKMSKDRSTKVGASLLKKYQIHPESWGYNGMVRGANDNLPSRHERPEKYLWTEHAERNLIFNEARKVLANKIVFCNRFPSIVEARAIASVGIKKVITRLPDSYTDIYEMSVNKIDFDKLEVSDDVKNYARVNQLFKESGIRIIYPLNSMEDVVQAGINLTKDDLSRMTKYKEYLVIVDGYAKRWCPEFLSNEEKRASLILDDEGYTPFALGVYDLPTRFKPVATDKEKKELKYYIPATCNAIYTTVKPVLEGSSLYASWCPCLDCSIAASEVGVESVYSKQPDFNLENDLRWKEHFESSLNFYKRIGMNHKFYSYRELDEASQKEKDL